MTWYVYLAHFVGGLFLANAVPHLVNGVSGRGFPSPFASPPGVGESAPLVNVMWGMANLVVAYLLLWGVGHFALGLSLDALVVGIAFLAAAAGLGRAFGRVYYKGT